MLMGCGDGFFASAIPQLTDLQVARARWERSGIDDYAMTLRLVCFCGYVGPVRITVVNDVVVSRVDVESGHPLAPQYEGAFPDIPALFDIAARALPTADQVELTFDAVYGYPRGAYVDRWIDMADDEYGWVVTAFSPAPSTR